ncbi:unnamed protein product [Strongylus vulgaris]|uniref:Uncharacterized protein n=1 Tax=Strongylus vulgaris TaxID=40348 RepID=A0A3P7LZJ7_STRVU|nr:unnamed protein product [Strongylus vulgaris]
MDRAAQELAMKMASMRTDLGTFFSTMRKKENIFKDWKPPTAAKEEVKRNDSLSGIPPRKKSSLKDVQQDSGGSLELPAHLASQPADNDNVSLITFVFLQNLIFRRAPDDPKLTAPAWADFETAAPELPPSESGFFSNKVMSIVFHLFFITKSC